jgi:uncharacterized protein
MKKNVFFILIVMLSNYANAQSNSNRPQTPQPPYTYNVDSVEYDNSDKSVHLGATFTYPKSGGPFITLLMITGSGLQDRDETIFNHHPFAVIADHLTKKGYAVLRVDDRNMGKSKGDIKNATSADFANDVLAGFNYLLQRKEVNKNKIGLIGHSEGGLIAPLVYTKEPRVAFIISLAGSGISGKEIAFKQTEMVKKFMSDDAYQALYSLNKKTLQIIYDNASTPDSITLDKIKTSFEDWKKSTPDSILKSMHFDQVTTKIYLTQIKKQLVPWTKYFLVTDPAQFWEKVKCPVLALNGEKDIQVDPSENIPAITKALQQAGNKNVTTKVFPGLNHLFQHCTKCTIQEYGELEETFSPEVLDTIGKWLDENIKK